MLVIETLGALMLREISKTSQKPGKPERRWFSSLKMDIFIWIDKQEIVGFQITYDKPHAEKALIWNIEEGFNHHAVDDGSQPGGHPGTPLLVADGVLNLPRLVFLLNQGFGEMEPEVKDFIVSRIINENP